MKNLLVNLGLIIGLLGIVSVLFWGLKIKPLHVQMKFDENIDIEMKDNIYITDDGKLESSITELVLGEAEKSAELVVYKQPVSITQTISNKTFKDCEWFKKYQNVHYNMTGQYYIDLSSLKEKNITVDKKNKKVIVQIDHAKLGQLGFDPNNCSIEDESKATLLAVGKLTMTMDQAIEFQKQVMDKVELELQKNEHYVSADAAAKEMVGQIFETIINVSYPDYCVEIVFKD